MLREITLVTGVKSEFLSMCTIFICFHSMWEFVDNPIAIQITIAIDS